MKTSPIETQSLSWNCEMLPGQLELCEVEGASTPSSYPLACESRLGTDRWFCQNPSQNSMFWILGSKQDLIRNLSAPPPADLSGLETTGDSGLFSLLGFVGLGLLGCENESQHWIRGRAAQETYVRFAENYASPEEQYRIKLFLENWEKNIRKNFPQLFEAFNGWVVEPVPPEKKAIAYYDPISKTVHISKGLDAYGHEFCHYVSHRYFREEMLFSDSELWQSLSCYVNGNPEEQFLGSGISGECVDDITNATRGEEEEFANVCAHAIGNVPAALLKYSYGERPLKQIEASAEALDMTPYNVEHAKSKIISGGKAELVLEADYDSFEIHSEGLDYANKMGSFISYQGSDYFAYALNDQKFILHYFESGGRKYRELQWPLGVDPTSRHSLFYQNGAAYFTQGEVLWKVDLTREDSDWEIYAQHPWIASEGLFFQTEGRDFYLQKGGIVELDARGNHLEQALPEPIFNLLQDHSYQLVKGGGENYLWIEQVDSGDQGQASQLYRIDIEGPSASFVKIFEAPATYTASAPLLMDGEWYLVDTVSNSPDPQFQQHLRQAEDVFVASVPTTHSAPVFLKIEEGGLIRVLSAQFERNSLNAESDLDFEIRMSVLSSLESMHLSDGEHFLSLNSSRMYAKNGAEFLYRFVRYKIR